MRLSSFEIRNYKGLEYASLTELHEHPLVILSGRNGTGKSLVLEALVAAWSGRYPIKNRVGPWGDEARVSMQIRLDPLEVEKINPWLVRNGQTTATAGSDYELTITASRYVGHDSPSYSPIVGLLRDQTFKNDHAFSTIDFMPATRVLSMSGGSPNVNLGLLSLEQVAQDRLNALDQTINYRSAMNLPGVADFLATLDYQSYLASRQGLQVEDDYERLSTPFANTTGKQLLKPQFDPEKGSAIEIELPTGHRHGLEDLSSGEQEMLAMMYYIRRLSAAGGILCIDEPEQHLHPTLQAALLTTMTDLANRSQVFVVTHSVNLIAAAPSHSVAQLRPPDGLGSNQISRLDDHPDKVALIGELGISSADLLQHDAILVVEGETDQQWLKILFPVEVGRTFVLVAGSSTQVQDAHSTLSAGPNDTPWLCLRDRDLMTDSDVEVKLARFPNLHIWPRRTIESHLLSSELIAATLKGIGIEASPVDIEVLMRTAADQLLDEALSAFVDAELSRLHPAPGKGEGGDRFQRAEAQLRAYSQINKERANSMQPVVAAERAKLEARWEADWKTLVEPKAVLGQLQRDLQAFKTLEIFKQALLAKARDDSSVRPRAFDDFVSKLRNILP